MRLPFFTADSEYPQIWRHGLAYLGVFIYFIGKTVFSHEVATAAVAL